MAITGLGMVSSLGFDVLTSCAAARAGLTRISSLKDYEIIDPETGDIEPISGHAITGITEGFTGLGLLVRMGVAALNDLKSNSNIVDWSKTGLVVNLSSGFHLTELEKEEYALLGEQENQENRNNLIHEMEFRKDKYKKKLISRLVKYSDLEIESSNQYILFKDQTGVIDTLDIALNYLQKGELERCIAGGIDSSLDAHFLKACHHFNLVKTPANSDGFLPGEAATFILVEKEETARRRNARILGIIQSWEKDSESFSRLSGQKVSGMSLSSTIEKTLENLHDGGKNTGLIIGNLNGDSYRAFDWGAALARLKAKFLFLDLPEWYPAISFGEIGAATGFAAICYGVRGFTRGYIGTDNILVWVEADSGNRGSFYLRNLKIG